MTKYYTPKGGLPPQSKRSVDRAIFTESYAVIPRHVMTDIVTSNLPGWDKTRAWILARPLSGFAETFAQYIVEIASGGGSQTPEPDRKAEAVLFVTEGEFTLSVDGTDHAMGAGSYAYLPPGVTWNVSNNSDNTATFHWIRKRYEKVDGIDLPQAFVTSDDEVSPTPMPNTDAWATSRFVDPSDLRHDMHVNIVTFQPGGVIPFDETHVMEHGIYILEGKANYHLNGDWVEVEAGDFLWLRAFCPQSCYAAGPGPFRYLLYKDVNRHPKLKL